MKFKRLISGAAAVALAVSSLSFSVSADLSKKPLEIGFETGQERQDSDDYDFLTKPYSVTSGDYYMGMGIQNGNWTHRNAIGSTDETGQTKTNVRRESVTGINARTPWAYLYGDGYASITKDANGVDLASAVTAYGPTGIFFDENEGQSGIKEYAKLHDVKIEDNGTYTVGIQGYNWKKDVAESYTSDNGNGISQLYITTNIDYLEENGVTIKNPVLKLYNSKEAYEAKKPDKTIAAGYWLTSPTEKQVEGKYVAYKDYTVYKFVNDWTISGQNNSELGKTVSFDSKYQSNIKSLDVFGLSGFSGTASSAYETGYSGCSYLPEYALELTFEVNVPDSLMNKVMSSPLKNVIDEVKAIIDDDAELAVIQGKNPSMTVEEIKTALTDAYNSANSVYGKYGNVQSLSKSTVTQAQKYLDDALAAIKKVCSDLGILIWGELNGYIEVAEGLDFTKYTADSWAAVEAAVAEAKTLKEKYSNNETVTQSEIDAAAEKLRAAIDALVEAKVTVDNTSGYGYLQFKDSTGAYQWYNDGKNYQNVTAKTVKVVTSDKGNGKTYTVKAKCDGTAKGLADCNLEIQNLIKKQETATVTIDEVKLDGKKQKLTGVPYTLAVDETNAYIPLYDATVTEIPDDAYTSPDGECAKDASPQALSQGAKKDYAALNTEWEEITVKFTVSWDDGTGDDSNSNNSENPATAGGVAVAASLVAVLAAGYVVSRKRSK